MQHLRSKYAIIIVIYRKNHHPSPLTATCTPSKHIERTFLSSDYSSLLQKKLGRILDIYK